MFLRCSGSADLGENTRPSVFPSTLPWRRSDGPWSPDNDRLQDNARQCFLYESTDQTRSSVITAGRFQLPVIQRFSLLGITTNCLLVMSCFKRPLLHADFRLQVRAWQIQWILNMLVEQQFHWRVSSRRLWHNWVAE